MYNWPSYALMHATNTSRYNLLLCTRMMQLPWYVGECMLNTGLSGQLLCMRLSYAIVSTTNLWWCSEAFTFVEVACSN